MAGELPCGVAWWDYAKSWELQIAEDDAWSRDGATYSLTLRGTATLTYDAATSVRMKYLVFSGGLDVETWKQRIDWDDPKMTGSTSTFDGGDVTAMLWILPGHYGDDADGILTIGASGDSTFETKFDDGCEWRGGDCVFSHAFGCSAIPVPLRPGSPVHAGEDSVKGSASRAFGNRDDAMPRSFDGDIDDGGASGHFKLIITDLCDDPARRPDFAIDDPGDIVLPPPPPRPSTNPPPEKDDQVDIVPDRSGVLTPADLATAVLGHPNLDFLDEHVSGEGDEATAFDNLISASDGEPAACSTYHADGSQLWTSDDYAESSSAPLDAVMLDAMLDLADRFYYRVMEIAGGQHPLGSAHFSGCAFDVDMIEGDPVAISAHVQEFMQAASDAGASLVLGPGYLAHDGHIHVEFGGRSGGDSGMSMRAKGLPQKVSRLRKRAEKDRRDLTRMLNELRAGAHEAVADLHASIHPEPVAPAGAVALPAEVWDALGISPDDDDWPFASDLPDPMLPPMPSRVHVLDDDPSVCHLSADCPALANAGPSSPYDTPLPFLPNNVLEIGDDELPPCERCLAAYGTDKPVRPLLASHTALVSLLVFADRVVISQRDMFGTLTAENCLNLSELYAVQSRGTGLIGRAKIVIVYPDASGITDWQVPFYERSKRDFALRLMEALAGYAGAFD